jgi:predicted ATPase
MLKSIRLVNFYSFKDTTIELNGGVNVLVGINGSGKSNFFRLFELLNEAIEGRGLRRHILEIGGINEIIYQGDRKNDEIIIVFEYEGPTNDLKLENYELETIYYEIKITPTQNEYYLIEKGWNKDNVFINREGEFLIGETNKIIIPKLNQNSDFELFLSSPTNFFNLTFSEFFLSFKKLGYINTIDTTSKSPIRKPILSIPEKELINGGGNLVQVLSTLKTNDKKTYKRVVDALRSVNPHFRDFDFRPFGTNFEMLLEEDGLNRSIHLSKVSDGTLRYLCLITALLTNRKSILCLDEPETGLHPDMLYNLAQAIKEAGETSTIIISTHSTQLLNYFDLETVRVFEKDEQNATQIYAYSEDDFKGWYETFQVGTMWRQGDIGGNRYGN